MGIFEYARRNPLPADPPEPKQVMGIELDDDYNTGWDEGALPRPEPKVVLVRVVD